MKLIVYLLGICAFILGGAWYFATELFAGNVWAILPLVGVFASVRGIYVAFRFLNANATSMNDFLKNVDYTLKSVVHETPNKSTKLLKEFGLSHDEFVRQYN